MDHEFQKDLRRGFVVALIAMTLFIVLLFKIGAKGSTDGYSFVNRLDTARQPAARALPAPPAHTNAEDVHVFCYHFFRAETSPVHILRVIGGLLLNLPVLGDVDIWTQSRREFDREMKYLHDNGYNTVSLNDMDAWRRGELTLPEKSVVLTFDDGDRSARDIVWPILREYGFTATLFIVTSQVGQSWEGVDGLTWEELDEMHRSGVFEIESHSHDLHYKVDTPDGPRARAVALESGFLEPKGPSWRDDIRDDLVESRRLIARHIGHDARHLAWPYGSTSTALDSIAADAGFNTVSLLVGGPNDILSSGKPTMGARQVYATHLRDDVLVRGVPTFVPKLAASRFAWERHCVRRYPITARTSIRDFKEMLNP